MTPVLDAIASDLQEIRDNNLYRELRMVTGVQGEIVTVKGRALINASSNNYLGLANHPALREAAIKATERYGTGSGAARLITGSMELHHELEAALAHFKNTEAALLFNSGYHANIGIITALVSENDHIFSDELNHASLIDGCRLARATRHVYRHRDVQHLEELLACAKISGRKLIVTDSLFSMDGDIAPVPAIVALAKRYDALVLIDEAHATGVFGAGGRGLLEYFLVNSDEPLIIQMGTLGKALGSFGAYVCATTPIIALIVNRARSFIYTTALPPAVCAASLAALRIVQSREGRALKESLWQNVRFFAAGLGELALANKLHLLPTASPIFPVLLGDNNKTMAVAEELFQRGVWAHPIRPPTVPVGTSRIRLALMATHTSQHLEQILGALGASCHNL